MIRFRWVFIVLALISGPMVIWGTITGMRYIFETYPMWLFLLLCACQVTVLVGLAFLADDLELRKSARELVRGIRRDRQQ